ncbi:MAG: hypothetical protein KAR19_08830 [Bacteroidales bacterium]|nr:hypothetical protein [Bacteroidales bacterium]
MIEFVHRKDIDTARWDELIAQSTAETLYPYSWYLDAAAANWSALIMDDYRFVMPLVWKRKYGLRYLYQPFYTQQLGVFSEEYVDPYTVTQFIDRMPKTFRFGTINFNMQNMVGEKQSFEVFDRSNYVLSLQQEYIDLYGSYSTNAKRNLKRSFDQAGEVEKDISLAELICFKKENDAIKRTDDAYLRMKKLLGSVIKYGRGFVYGIKDGNELSAAAFFGFSKTRVIYLLSVSSMQGKENRAMFKIVDEFIRTHTGSELVLDFEGSSIPSIARFFSGFGAKPEIYQSLSFNRLAFPLKMLRNRGR